MSQEMTELVEVLLDRIKETRTHHILLSFSFIFVLLSISFNRYFFETFFTFIYAVWIVFIQLARGQKTGKEIAQTLSFLLFLVTLVWAIVIFFLSEYFPLQRFLFY